MSYLDMPLDPANDGRRACILSLPVHISGELMPADVADAISGLWHDPGVLSAIYRSRDNQLNDSAT